VPCAHRTSFQTWSNANGHFPRALRNAPQFPARQRANLDTTQTPGRCQLWQGFRDDASIRNETLVHLSTPHQISQAVLRNIRHPRTFARAALASVLAYQNISTCHLRAAAAASAATWLKQVADGLRRPRALFFVSSRCLAEATRTRALALGTTPTCHNVFVRHSNPSSGHTKDARDV
jgi:hypothetical protein